MGAYGFEENGSSVTDLSGSGNTGTLSGATRTSAGRFGAALSFDGDGDSVVVPDAASLHLHDGMTLEAWVYPTDASSGRPALLKGDDADLVYGLFTTTGDGANAAAQILMDGAPQTAFAPDALPLNAWSHLAATYDGAKLQLYVDGRQVASRDVAGGIAADTHALRFGGSELLGRWFAGRLDEIRIYDRALTLEQLNADMDRPVNP